MSRTRYKVATLRGANQLAANPERIESPDRSRWATGRNVKRSLGDRRFDAVQVWTLKRRDRDGKVEIVDTMCDRDEAVAWCTL